MVLYKFKWYQDTEYWDERETNNWNIVTGYMDDQYTAFGICDGYLYKLYGIWMVHCGDYVNYLEFLEFKVDFISGFWLNIRLLFVFK